MTLGFFLLLLVLAFGADRYNAMKVRNAKDLTDKEEDEKK